MAEEFESIELEVSEEDILYYIVDEDDNQVGFAVMEDGEEVEYYYDEDPEMFEPVEMEATSTSTDDADEDVVELEVSEDDIIYRIVDENDIEIGFAVLEDGEEVEYYYEEVEVEEVLAPPVKAESTPTPKPAPEPEPEEPKERGYLYKIASIAGHGADKTRKKAEVKLDKVRGVAEKQVDKAAAAVEAGGKKIKEKREETDLGITREDIAETTADLNVIAKEGAETAKELKAAYDDIMDSFGFLVPKKIKRRLP